MTILYLLLDGQWIYGLNQAWMTLGQRCFGFNVNIDYLMLILLILFNVNIICLFNVNIVLDLMLIMSAFFWC